MTNTANSDAALVAASLEGDLKAFEDILRRHERSVVAAAAGVSGDLGCAEDLAQEAFVVAWKDLPKLRDPQRVGPWLRGIARTLGKAEVRRRARRREVEPGEDAGARDLRSELEARDRDRLLAAALLDLPTADREPLLLFYFEEESARAVGTALGIGEDAAAKRISRARARLGEKLEAMIAAGVPRPSGRAVAGALVAIAALGPVGCAPLSVTQTTSKGLTMTTRLILILALVAAAGTATAVAWSEGVGHEERKPTADLRRSITDHRRSIAADRSPITADRSPITADRSPITADRSLIPAVRERTTDDAYYVRIQSPDASLRVSPTTKAELTECMYLPFQDGPTSRDGLGEFELAVDFRRDGDNVRAEVTSDSDLGQEHADAWAGCFAAVAERGLLPVDRSEGKLTLAMKVVDAPMPEAEVYDSLPVADAPGWGPDGAAVELTAFVDYTCPYSRKLVAELDELRARHPDELRVAIRHHVLHEKDRRYALAALAADDLGAFGAVFDAIFAHQDELEDVDLGALAESAGLSTAVFRSRMNSPEVADRLAEDAALAETFGIRGTPTMLINGHRMTGHRPWSMIAAIVDDELGR